MFKTTPAIEWLERDYDAVTVLEFREYPEQGVYAGLRHFEAAGRYRGLGDPSPGLLFSLKRADDGGRSMRWNLKSDLEWTEINWGLPLDREVRWL